MLISKSNFKGLKWKAFLGVLFTSLLFVTANAQEPDKNKIVDYGEKHPLVFISGIFVLVAIAVVVVYFIFKRTSKEEQPSQGFSKPTARTSKHPADRRYISKKSIPR